MSCLALSLQPTNGPDILLQTREWFPPSRALMALSSFRQTRLSFAKSHHQSAAGTGPDPDPSSDSLGDDPLAASSGQLIVGVESRYRVVYRLVNSIYVLAVTTIDDSNNNVFECINIVNQAVSIVVTACRGVDVTPEKLGKKYAEIYMALDIVLRGVSSIRLAAMLASMHGDGIAKMVHSAVHTESKIRGADTWGNVEPHAVDHEASVGAFSNASFELPSETLQAGDEVAAATFSQQGTEEKDSLGKADETEAEKDPFAASDRINKPPEELLIEGFKKDKDSGLSDMSKALAGLEITSLPPAAATEATQITVDGFEGRYGGVEFGTGGSTLKDDFEGHNSAWGGGLDASEFVGPKKVPKDLGLGGLEFINTSEPPPAAVAKGGDADKIVDMLVQKTQMKGPEMYIVEEISAEFRESILARVGLKGVVYLKTVPPKPSSDNTETEFSFKVDGTAGVKRFVVENSKISSLGNGLFHVRTPPSDEPMPIMKYSLLPRMTPLPIRVRLVKRLSGTLLSIMIQYASNPDLPVPLNDVTIVLKLPVDPTLLKVSPKAVWNRSERELKWHIDEIPLKGNPGRLRARLPLEIDDDDDGSDLEIVGYVKFSAIGKQSLSGICLGPASEGKTDFYEVDHRYASGVYICN
ncbi:hypothetical protein ABFX02_10G138700 [Erythranthe guttata]